MSYGPFDPWDEAETYSTGDRVSYEGYIYEAMTSIAAGDNPRSATYSLLGGTFRKWRVWDLPASYIMARLRGLPENVLANEGGVVSPMPEEIHLVQVRADYQYNGSPEADLYLQPTSMSSAGYGMPKGMDSNWGTPSEGELVWSFSASRYEDGKPYAYDYNLGTDSGIVYSPTTILPKARYDTIVGSNTNWAFYPAYATETQGQLISCYQTFGRTFDWIDEVGATDTAIIPAFADSFNTAGNGFTTNNENPIGDTIGTDPDYKDG